MVVGGSRWYPILGAADARSSSLRGVASECFGCLAWEAPARVIHLASNLGRNQDGGCVAVRAVHSERHYEWRFARRYMSRNSLAAAHDRTNDTSQTDEKEDQSAPLQAT